MGGPIFRALAVAPSFGFSELAQEKPFQDFGNDSPTGGFAGSPARFLPGGAQIASLGDIGTDAMVPEIPEPAATPVLGEETSDAERVAEEKKAAAEEERRRRGNQGKASTILTSPDDAVVGSGVSAKRFLGGF